MLQLLLRKQIHEKLERKRLHHLQHCENERATWYQVNVALLLTDWGLSFVIIVILERHRIRPYRIREC